MSQVEPGQVTSPALLFSIQSLAQPCLATLQPHLLSILVTLLTKVHKNNRDMEEEIDGKEIVFITLQDLKLKTLIVDTCSMFPPAFNACLHKVNVLFK